MYLDNPALATCETYTPGLSSEFVSEQFSIPLGDVAKLGSAENPFGASRLAAAAVEKAISRMEIYPEWTAQALREKIAARYGVDADCVICGAGETEIFSWLVRVFSSPGDKLLMYNPCFPIYHMTSEAENRLCVGIPMGPEFEFRIDEYISALDSNEIRIAFLTTPHSPTGKLMDEADIRRVIEAAGDTLVVVDEAYIHFSRTDGNIHLAQEYDNAIVMRTFSKAFGLAGLRAGFGIAHPDIIRPLMAIKPTWNMGILQVAGASAALDDDEHVDKTVNMIVEMREYVSERLRGLNSFRMIPGSRSNFFTLEILDDRHDSSSVFNSLLERGVIVKDGNVSFRGFGKRYLRVDVNFQKHMDRLVDALMDIEAARAK